MSLDNVIVFDGVCNLCSKSVQFIIRRDKHAVFRFAPLQSTTGADLLKQHGIDPADARTFLLVKDGRAYLRSDAALQVFKQLRGPWKLLAILVLVPRPMRDWLYNVLARNRAKWFGTQESCMVPTADTEARFLK